MNKREKHANIYNNFVYFPRIYEYFHYLHSSICSDVYKIQEGIGDKVGMLIQSVSSFITAFVIGFTKGWKLTLVILAVSPALGISGALFSKVTQRISLSL